MQYFVLASDGKEYGPATVETLQQWVAENRLTPQHMLKDAATGQSLPASQVPSLFPAAAPVSMAPPVRQDPAVIATPQPVGTGASHKGPAIRTGPPRRAGTNRLPAQMVASSRQRRPAQGQAGTWFRTRCHRPVVSHY